MPRRAPPEIGIGRRERRREPHGVHFGYPVLEEGKQEVVPCELGVGSEDPVGVLGGAEAVHQQQRHRGSGLPAQGEDLAGDEVEEAEPAPDLEQRFGAIEAHRGAQSAVELDHRGPLQGIDASPAVGLKFVCVRELGHRPDSSLGEEPALALEEAAKVEPERGDGGPWQSPPLHQIEEGLLGGVGGRCFAHGAPPFRGVDAIIQGWA